MTIPVMVDALFDDLTQAIRSYGSKARADKEKSYQKSSWEHWGVAFPKIDGAIRDRLRGIEAARLIPLAETLWSEPVWDLKIASGRVLALDRVPPSDRLWEIVVERVPEMDGWAVEDNMARVAWKCLLDDPDRLMTVATWVSDERMWVRRASLVYTLPWTKAGRDPETMLGWAGRLAEDREWFIQKAIGWWLRELGKVKPDRVTAFVNQYGDSLKAVARREAVKYLDGRK